MKISLKKQKRVKKKNLRKGGGRNLETMLVSVTEKDGKILDPPHVSRQKKENYVSESSNNPVCL